MITKLTIKEQIYSQLYDDIIEGEFNREMFITEGQLVERYSVSKAPVREALVELCNERVLKSIPRLGYQIVPVTDKDIRDMTEMRLILEMTAYKELPNIFTPEMLSQITRLNQEWRQEAERGEINLHSRWKHNALFHTTLASFFGNELLTDTVRKLISTEFRAYAQMLSTPEERTAFFNDTSDKPHLEIEKALSERAFETARKLLMKDILLLQSRTNNLVRLSSLQL